MNTWRYYETWDAPYWRINNDETNEYFLCGSEKQAEWLTDKLNDSERITRFDEGFALTDEGDLVKVKEIPDGGSSNLYRRVNGYE